MFSRSLITNLVLDFYKFKMADLMWLRCCDTISMELLEMSLSLYISWYILVYLGFLGNQLQIWSQKVKMQDG